MLPPLLLLDEVDISLAVHLSAIKKKKVREKRLEPAAPLGQLAEKGDVRRLRDISLVVGNVIIVEALALPCTESRGAQFTETAAALQARQAAHELRQLPWLRLGVRVEDGARVLGVLDIGSCKCLFCSDCSFNQRLLLVDIKQSVAQALKCFLL